jgi:hypothetical protein
MTGGGGADRARVLGGRPGLLAKHEELAYVGRA